MNLLDDARKEISAADKIIAEQFEKRMHAVENVAKYKKEHSLPVFDAGREDALVKKNLGYISDSNIRDLYVLFQKQVMEISKKYQSMLISGQKVAFSGIEGAYAHIAATKIFPESTAYPMPNFEKAYRSVEKGECDAVILPIENSMAGEVGANIDMMFAGSLYITGIYELQISHNLLAKPGTELSEIKKVISHSQALEQCRDFIERNGLTTINEVNTATAAKKVAESDSRSIAAIASKETAELYGLEIIKESINENSSNTTRFAVLSRERHIDEKNNLFTLVFIVKHEAGALAKAIDIIGEFGFNMQMIKSRPLRSSLWQYYFFTEIEGNPDSENGKKMLERLGEFCLELKVLGSYGKHIKIESQEVL